MAASLTVLRGSNLLNPRLIKKPLPFCTVRVEGHQRNTSTGKGVNPEWNAQFGFRVVDHPTAVVEIYIYDDVAGNDVPLGRVTFPLKLIEPGTPFQQVFTVEPMRVNPRTLKELPRLA